MKNISSNKRLENSFAFRGRIIWLFTKYQLLSKGFLALIIYPIYSISTNIFFNLSGRTGISSGDFISFIISFQGIAFLISTFIILTVLIGLDINSFILAAALIKEKKIEMSARSMLLLGLKSLKYLFRPTALLLILYVSLIIPLLGLGITIGPMKNFRIPNFITSVIYDNSLYLLLYTLVLLVLFYISYRLMFSFHYMLISEKGIKDSILASFALTKTYGIQFIKRLFKVFFKSGIFYIIPFIVSFIILIGIGVSANYGTLNQTQSRFLYFSIIFIILELATFLAFISPAMLIYNLTDAFYDYEALEGRLVSLSLKHKATMWNDNIEHKVRLRTKFLLFISTLCILLINIFIAYIFADNFDTIFRVNHNIALIAHRGGGDLSAENSLDGILAVANKGAEWSEIDIQRTKDGYYILNHDTTLGRVAGNNKAASEMTLKEIKTLKIKDAFNPTRPDRPVATLNEVLEAAKGKIGLFIELKGKTSDTRMVDDVVAMVKSYNMEKEIALLSLDYKLIEYIEETYPEIDSGYLYYFSIGEPLHLKSDYLIMEEDEASRRDIEALQRSGKKVVVWTVNTEDSINQFINSSVDGIITDHILKVEDGIKARDARSDLEIIIDYFLN